MVPGFNFCIYLVVVFVETTTSVSASVTFEVLVSNTYIKSGLINIDAFLLNYSLS